jgi:hypothetical protein
MLVDFLDTTETSSYFNRRIAALQGFGLLNRTSDETVQLTDLAVQIAKPVAGEDKEAKLAAFRKVDVLAGLLQKYYPNAKLPADPDVLRSVLLKSFAINRDTIKPWYEFVVDSFRAISGISTEKQPTSVNVTDTVGVTDSVNVTMQKNFSLPLPSGKTFRYSIEGGYTAEDLDFIQKFMELLKTSVGQK